MKVISLQIPDVKVIEANLFKDNRGFFLESYSKRNFEKAGIQCNFVQDNHSSSKEVGIVRGLHFQFPPYAQSKLIRVTKGRIWDVAVDLRKASPTYSHHVSIELSATTPKMLFIPAGFAHGFVTLAPNSEVQYKTDAYYTPNQEGGIRWDDPDLAIEWPIKSNSVILSKKDALLPAFKELNSTF